MSQIATSFVHCSPKHVDLRLPSFMAQALSNSDGCPPEYKPLIFMVGKPVRQGISYTRGVKPKLLLEAGLA